MALRDSSSTTLWISIFAATTIGFASSTLLSSSISSRLELRALSRLRSQLPRTLEEWSLPGGDDTFANPLWLKLEDFFKERGYILWQPTALTYLRLPRELQVTCNGFAFAPLHRGWYDGSPVAKLSRIDCPNAMLRAARTADGRDVVIRVICVGSQGRTHLDVLKYVAKGICSVATPNHAVPLFEVCELEDITFGIFPRVAFSMWDAYRSWPQSSVGDVIDMIMQALEALAFLESVHVAHRDAFIDNFLVQWFPESLAPGQVTVGRPRVFINDFETAVRFDRDSPASERTCVGLPLCPTFPVPERYFRPVPPEVSSGKPYNPFKLDVWQLGTSLNNFKSTIQEIDDILLTLAEEDPDKRPGAYPAFKSLARIVHSMPEDHLNIAPVVIKP